MSIYERKPSHEPFTFVTMLLTFLAVGGVIAMFTGGHLLSEGKTIGNLVGTAGFFGFLIGGFGLSWRFRK